VQDQKKEEAGTSYPGTTEMLLHRTYQSVDNQLTFLTHLGKHHHDLTHGTTATEITGKGIERKK